MVGSVTPPHPPPRTLGAAVWPARPTGPMMDEFFCWPGPYPAEVHLFAMDPDRFRDIRPWFEDVP